MTGNKEVLGNFKKISGGYVNFAGEKGGFITGEGSVTNGKITLHKVNYVEELKHNLMSVSQICDNGYKMLFTDKACFVLKPGVSVPKDWVVMRAPRVHNTYVMDMRPLVAHPVRQHACYQKQLKMNRSCGTEGWDMFTSGK